MITGFNTVVYLVLMVGNSEIMSSPPHGEARKQKLYSHWQMMTITGSFQGGKKTDPRPRRQTRSGKLADASCGQPLPSTLQLNIEDLTQSKICVISQLATRHRALFILLRETHCTTPNQLVIPNFTLAGWTMSWKYGLATFVHEGFGWTLADQSLDGSVVGCLCVDVDGVTIINVYKPPTSRMTPSAIPVFPHLCLYASDLNCQHVDWGYSTISSDGESLVDWATKSNLALLHNPKDAPSFFSGRWKIGLLEQGSRLLATGQTHPGKAP